ncbi:hypothetical protein OH797_32020 [Streptomyces anulatus]|jgi:hypothetical protein|uniref:hypothetical protein n=1 Tax=Streptomyces TaxID=1883 RepID=UPI0029A69CF8|nr:hypothetical protein [Streptomyces scabiei]MDX3206042.1 hypothetical protein [Streptomyces scabiei]
MIETRKHYAEANVEITVVYDDGPESLTYVLVATEEGTAEFNLTPADLNGLTSVLYEAQAAKHRHNLSF